MPHHDDDVNAAKDMRHACQLAHTHGAGVSVCVCVCVCVCAGGWVGGWVGVEGEARGVGEWGGGGGGLPSVSDSMPRYAHLVPILGALQQLDLLGKVLQIVCAPATRWPGRPGLRVGRVRL